MTDEEMEIAMLTMLNTNAVTFQRAAAVMERVITQYAAAIAKSKN